MVNGNRSLRRSCSVIAALVLGSAAASAGAAPSKVAVRPPPKPPRKHHGGVAVAIAYRHGLLILSSSTAGRAQILIRSADGARKWVATVNLQTPTTTLRLKTLFPKITKGRYRIVVSPAFDGGFLSGVWIVVH